MIAVLDSGPVNVVQNLSVVTDLQDSIVGDLPLCGPLTYELQNLAPYSVILSENVLTFDPTGQDVTAEPLPSFTVIIGL